VDVVTGAADVQRTISARIGNSCRRSSSSRSSEVLAHGFEVPQRCVHRVVFGSLTASGSGWEHPGIHNLANVRKMRWRRLDAVESVRPVARSSCRAPSRRTVVTRNHRERSRIIAQPAATMIDRRPEQLRIQAGRTCDVEGSASVQRSIQAFLMRSARLECFRAARSGAGSC